MLHISALEKLVHELSRLPGIGPKTAQRLTYRILKSGTAILSFSVKLFYVLRPRCMIVLVALTTPTLICVVIVKTLTALMKRSVLSKKPADIMRIESSGAFRGRYHVLHGAISPLEGIGPKEL